MVLDGAVSQVFSKHAKQLLILSALLNLKIHRIAQEKGPVLTLF
jgi:hypothetical protein